jgi:hypothetical protein
MPTEKGLLGHFLWAGIGWFDGMAYYSRKITPILNFFIRMPVFRKARGPVVYDNGSVSRRRVILLGMIVSGSSSYLSCFSFRS